MSELSFLYGESTAEWSPGTDSPDVVFLYELSLVDGAVIDSSSQTETRLHLPQLQHGQRYVLSVWEQCDGLGESQRSSVVFDPNDSPADLMVRAARPKQGQGQSAAE